MKICPNCRKTYPDDNLNFCLEDGTVLTLVRDEPPATVMMNQPRPTDPRSVAGQGIQSSFGASPQYAPPARRSSKTWLWVVGVLGILLLLCGGAGVVGILFYATIDQGNSSQNGSNRGPLVANNNGGKTFPGNISGSPTPGSDDVESIDLSYWVRDFSVWGTTEMSGDEFQMAAKQKDYYYVLVAPEEYVTDNRSTRVTVRNVDNANSKLGYGLIINSAPTPLTKDYAFLIDTKKKKYRIVRHEPTKEIPMIGWTNSSAINEGGAENVLEAKDKGDTIEFYINDQMVNSVKDSYGYPNGVPGLYSGDGVKIGFKKLEIRK